MKKKFLLALCLVGTAALAQTSTFGVASRVEGLVTFSEGLQIGSLQAGATIAEGTRIVTGSAGSAVIDLERGCQVTLGPNQLFTAVRGKSCPELIASIENLAPSRAGTLLAWGGDSVVLPLLGVAAAGLLVGAGAGGGGGTLAILPQLSPQ